MRVAVSTNANHIPGVAIVRCVHKDDITLPGMARAGHHKVDSVIKFQFLPALFFLRAMGSAHPIFVDVRQNVVLAQARHLLVGFFLQRCCSELL